MEAVAHPTEHPGPPPSHRLYAVPRVEARVHQELDAQLDAALAFADFCNFLTAGRMRADADELVALAQALHAGTSEDLSRSRPGR